jgi:hypothetical protein
MAKDRDGHEVIARLGAHIHTGSEISSPDG